jgi:hypothetical protein
MHFNPSKYIGLLLARVWAICSLQRWIAIFAFIPFLGYLADDLVSKK